MRTLGIDIETYSSIDLIAAGVYKYAEDPDFAILLFGYAWDDEPVQIVDLAQGEKIPEDVEDALQNLDVIKTAFNANFERTCLDSKNGMGQRLLSNEWDCTMVRALSLGLPGSLDGVAKALGLAEQKDRIGRSLVTYFCKPCTPTRVNNGRRRNLPHHDSAKWELFKGYCKQDVEVERAIRNALPHKPPAWERRLWALDQEINDCGVKIDSVLVQNAIICDMQHRERLTAEAISLTGLDNPNSVQQLTRWLSDAEGVEIEKLTKETLPALIKAANSTTTKRVLEIRQELSKTSVKKYAAMDAAVCDDDRVRGLLQFCGAGRTGRWAGRLVQVQNLPQNKLPDLALARRLVREGKFEILELLFGNVPDTLSQLIRTAFIPGQGSFIVADYSAIEARVIAWLAGEKWRQEVFATHGKIYEASASAMFHIPLDQITKPIRQKGKVAELALGYQGGPRALEKMGALKMGLTLDELPGLVSAWREANTAIVKLWTDTENAAKQAIETRHPVILRDIVVFTLRESVLYCKLPSGRELAYQRPKIERGSYGRDQITYEGQDQTTKQWRRMPTYGGKLVENIVQAIARDCLGVSMLRLADAGYKIVMHVHDEVIIEAYAGHLQRICESMGAPIYWAPGLQLRADGYTTDFYKKD